MKKEDKTPNVAAYARFAQRHQTVTPNETRVAIYCKADPTLNEKARRADLTRQQGTLRELAEALGFEVVQIYEDDTRTQTASRLLADYNQRKIDAVFTTERGSITNAPYTDPALLEKMPILDLQDLGLMQKLRPLRVLSIDFDYFLRANDPKAWCYYPDSGCEFNPEIQKVVWITQYASAIAHGDDLTKLFSLDNEALQKLEDFLRNKCTAKKYLIAESHSSAYKFIKDLSREAGKPVEVFNIDHHSDTYTTGELNCGNWLKLLLEKNIVTSAVWCMDIKKEDPYMDKRVQRMDDLDACLNSGPFDAVFLCRSGGWVPPHMDKKFVYGLIKAILDRAYDDEADEDESTRPSVEAVNMDYVISDRYNDEFQKSVKDMAEIEMKAIQQYQTTVAKKSDE